VIRLDKVTKSYPGGDGGPVRALSDISLAIEPGAFVALRGPSGSGKSSLLNILGCLDAPTSGSYLLEGADVSRCSDTDLSRIRSAKIGFVFQSFNLLDRTTALEQVELPMLFGPGRVDREKAASALDRVGLSHRARHYPGELSGGEQQRVAIARALINDPILILADEPTGNLDVASGGEVLRILRELNGEGRTIVLVTHDPVVARVAGSQIALRDGHLEGGRKEP
jgi:putative ABC transport system ATP-binding protein